MAFARHPHETIDSLLSRFEELRFRAARERHYIMSIEDWSWRLLQNCPLTHAQNLHVLEPFHYQMPHTEEDFQRLIDRLRRVGHQAENGASAMMRMLGNDPREGGYHYQAVPDHDEETQEAPPAFMMQPGPATSQNSMSWPAAASSWQPANA